MIVGTELESNTNCDQLRGSWTDVLKWMGLSYSFYPIGLGRVAG